MFQAHRIPPEQRFVAPDREWARVHGAPSLKHYGLNIATPRHGGSCPSFKNVTTHRATRNEVDPRRFEKRPRWPANPLHLMQTRRTSSTNQRFVEFEISPGGKSENTKVRKASTVPRQPRRRKPSTHS